MASQLFKGQHSEWFPAHRVKSLLEQGWTAEPVAIEPEDKSEEVKEKFNEIEEKVDSAEDEIEKLENLVEELESKQKEELEQLDLPEIRKMAKGKEIKGWHNAKKETLIQRLIDVD